MLERFILYAHYGEMIEELTDDQAGRLIKAIFWYLQDGNIPTLDDLEVQTILRFICKQIEYDGSRYKVCGKGK